MSKTSEYDCGHVLRWADGEDISPNCPKCDDGQRLNPHVD